MNKIKVLFLCTGNSARSQMAEALLRKYAGDLFEIFSAGLEPKGLNPYTVRVLEEIGVNASRHYAKPLTDFLGKDHFDYLITVCSQADQNCPVLPGMGMRMHWPFEDPATFEGADEETLLRFRQIRDEIEEKIKEWLGERGQQVT